jgi:hypothetical protein
MLLLLVKCKELNSKYRKLSELNQYSEGSNIPILTNLEKSN